LAGESSDQPCESYAPTAGKYGGNHPPIENGQEPPIITRTSQPWLAQHKGFTLASQRDFHPQATFVPGVTQFY
jgi:hypothetical protein